MNSDGYLLIPESDVRTLAQKIGLNLDTGNDFRLWAPPYDKTPSLTITERPLDVDEYGHFWDWQERDIEYLVEHFSEMVVDQGYTSFLALPGIYADADPGNHFYKWMHWLIPAIHREYIEFMREARVDKNFNGGIRFSAKGFRRFLAVSAQHCFEHNSVVLNDGSKEISHSNIYIICINKPCIFYSWHHSAIIVFPQSREIHREFLLSVPEYGLHVHAV